ncbi:MAG: endolytic transglycosylase MltG, partial [Acidobacteriota bacterium]
MKRLVGLMFVLLALAAAGLGAWTYLGLNKQYQGYAEPEQYVEIPAGSGTATIGRRLADAGVVRDANTFRLALWLTGEGRRLQAGEYRFDRPMTVKEVIAKIVRGDVFLRPITFREGLTIRQMAELYESKGFGAAAEFVAAARNPEPIRDLDPRAQDLEGYLFPDTYTLPRH